MIHLVSGYCDKGLSKNCKLYGKRHPKVLRYQDFKTWDCFKVNRTQLKFKDNSIVKLQVSILPQEKQNIQTNRHH